MLEGLSITVLKLSSLPIDNPKLRLDSQFQNPRVLKAIERIREKPSLQVAELSANSIKGRNVEYSENGVVPIIRSGDVGQFPNKNAYLLAEKSEPIRYLESGDVLISSIGFGSIGKVQLFDSDDDYGAVGEITIIRQRKVKPAFLASFMASKFGQMQIERWITGATGQLHLYPSDVDQIYVPIFSNEFQNTVVQLYKLASVQFDNSLDFERTANNSLMSALGLADWRPPESQHYVKKLSDLVAASRIDSAYFDPQHVYAEDIIADRSYENLVDTVDFVESGPAWPSSIFREFDDPDGLPFVRIRNCKPGFVDVATLDRLSKEGVSKFRTPMAESNDIVIGMDGLKWFYAGVLTGPAYINQRVSWMRLKKDGLDPMYVQLVINSPLGQAQLLRRMTIANTVGHITLDDIRAIKIPILDNRQTMYVIQKLKLGQAAMQEAAKLLLSAKRAVEIAIEEDEAAAFAFLEKWQLEI